MRDTTYRRLLTVLLILGLISAAAITIYTIVAYRSASILDYIAGEIW